MLTKNHPFPRNMLLQWHITHQCNLRCTHCYQEDYEGEELDFQQLLHILDQYKQFLVAPCDHGLPPIRGHITVTGGEPFVRQDFLKLLAVFGENKNLFSFAVLTNGSLIDRSLARHLKKRGPRFVQVSLDGNRSIHDRLRGPGHFDQTLSALKQLKRAGIPILISFTAHRGNFKEFSDVAAIGRRLRASRVWADRLVPQGSGSNLNEQSLTPRETKTFFELMAKERKKSRRAWLFHTDLAMHRALQFLKGNGPPYRCRAGDTLLTLMPNGDLYPCRRMPIPIGNVLETPLWGLYQQNTLLQNLRDPNHIAEACRPCPHAKTCRGGLKCLSYATTGDPFQKDPGCWMGSTSI